MGEKLGHKFLRPAHKQASTKVIITKVIMKLRLGPAAVFEAKLWPNQASFPKKHAGFVREFFFQQFP